MLLSVLDQSPIAEGSTGAQALHNTLDLARVTDSLGYHRYWVAEHHGGPMLAGPSPEVLIGPIAAATERIRVGCGGVMLPHYSPLKVAESFTILAALFPGRIDLGLGRAAGTDPLTTFALQRDRRQAAPDDFPQQLAELLAYLEDDLPEDHPFRHLAAQPPRPAGAAGAVAARLLGAERDLGRRARACATRSPTSSTRGGAEIAKLYRERFAAGARPQGAPYRRRRVGAVRAHRRGGPAPGLSSQMAFKMLRRGQLIPSPPPRRRRRGWPARADRATRVPAAGRSSARRRRCGPASRRLASEYGADEVIVVTITHDHGARKRSYELLADAFGLQPRRELAAAAA